MKVFKLTNPGLNKLLIAVAVFVAVLCLYNVKTVDGGEKIVNRVAVIGYDSPRDLETGVNEFFDHTVIYNLVDVEVIKYDHSCFVVITYQQYGTGN